MKKSMIIIDQVDDHMQTILDRALYLCQSVSELPSLVWFPDSPISSDVLSWINHHSIKALNSSQIAKGNKFNIFDDLELSCELLIVVVGDKKEISEYLQNRIKNTAHVEVNWNIISANTNRFTFLESQHALTEFIPVDTYMFVKSLISKYGIQRILSYVTEIGRNRTFVIGESIIDKFIHCDALGKVSKDPLIAFQKIDEVVQLGGVLAVSKHLASLGAKIHLCTETTEEYKTLLESEFFSITKPKFDITIVENAIVKTRFVDRASGNKMFETYDLDMNYSNERFKSMVGQILQSLEFDSTNIIIMDYGHGLIDTELRNQLLKTIPNVTVNAQTNAGNRGFHSISRYQGVNTLFLNGSEVLLEVRDKNANLDKVIPRLAQDHGITEIYVTNGANGIMAWNQEEGLNNFPAFSPRIVDRIGAGDATLAVISSLRAANAPSAISSFFGNIAGAMLISSIGNETTISVSSLLSHATAILQKVDMDE